MKPGDLRGRAYSDQVKQEPGRVGNTAFVIGHVAFAVLHKTALVVRVKSFSNHRSILPCNLGVILMMALCRRGQNECQFLPQPYRTKTTFF